MKLLGSVSQLHLGLSRVFLFSTQTQTPTASLASKDSIHSWIFSLRFRPATIRPALDQWVKEGRELDQPQLHGLIKTLKKTRHFSAALQVSNWMYDKGSYNLSIGYLAIRLDLIAKALGLRQAQKYFNGLPDELKVSQIYGALLNCYVNHKCLDEAETIMQKIRELSFSDAPLQYNVMLNLYAKMGRHDKFEKMVQEMEEKGIKPDKITYGFRLNALAAAFNLEGMEKLLEKMESDPQVMEEWNAYADAASCYLKVGRVEKYFAMLKRAEECMREKPGKNGYEHLLTLYAATGHKDEVYRIWNLYTNLGRLQNRGYCCMISSLVKLNDLDGAHTIFSEWLSWHGEFAMKIPGMLITAYCKKGLMDKAEAIVNTLIENGKEPNAIIWNQMATRYCNDGQMDKAVETLKKAIIATSPREQMPNHSTLAPCLQYLRKKGDNEAAVEMFRLQPRFYTEMQKLYYAQLNEEILENKIV